MGLKKVEGTPSDTHWVAPFQRASVLLELWQLRQLNEVVQQDKRPNGILLAPEFVELLAAGGGDSTGAILSPASLHFRFLLRRLGRSFVGGDEFGAPESGK